ncbi:hypothetical protein HMPREF1093_03527 [Hungatella hathewayi 12489931]|uniref:DUF5067 domain-containing protein n=1 Tax=Hungatella hathewayi TaxID=154046 RepID=UPI0002D1CEA8|nr:DUF5067 domain-containing protein [Hungatella hathewayi]ENY93451.1 hypothetical protein HMPREF1093_03527 [Hungatella hathewayi 12489931]
MKRMKLFVATLAMSAAMATTALAGEWKQDQTGWWYQNDDGSYSKSGWHNIDGQSYYFGDDGYMFHDCVTPDGYTVGSDGSWVQETTVPAFDFAINNCSIKYTNHKVMTADYDGYPCVALYYDYTNNSKESESAMMADYSIKVFQNGLECDTTFLSYDDKEEAFNNYSKEVLPGTTVNVAKAYRIKDMSDVTVQIKELWNWNDPKSTTVTLNLRN